MNRLDLDQKKFEYTQKSVVNTVQRPYSQQFIFLVTYECYSLLGLVLSCEEHGVVNTVPGANPSRKFLTLFSHIDPFGAIVKVV